MPNPNEPEREAESDRKPEAQREHEPQHDREDISPKNDPGEHGDGDDAQPMPFDESNRPKEPKDDE